MTARATTNINNRTQYLPTEGRSIENVPLLLAIDVLTSMPKKALLRGLITAVLLVAGESFVQANMPNRRGNATMRFTNTQEETDAVTAETAELNKKPDFKVKTWNPLRLAVLRLGLTEPAATSPFNYGKYDGQFTCAYCGNLLFDSNAKYDSGSGWPSFWRTAEGTSLDYKMEFDGRLECRCSQCKSHLGHVFLDGPTPSSVDQPLLEASPESDPRGKTGRYLPRFCINGAAMNFQKREE